MGLTGAALAFGFLLQGCEDGFAAAERAVSSATDTAPSAAAFYANSFSKTPTVPAMTAIGRELFFDVSFSASGKISCATCHDPRFAFGPPNARAVQMGGPDQKQPGVRAVPSLRYLQNVPPFSEHYFDEAVDESTDQGPTGGRTWDGRANSAHDQALLPLLSPFEMANANTDHVADKVRRAAYANRMREVFGDDVFSSNAKAIKAVLMSLEVFQQDPKQFYPYNSKYDAWLRGQSQLSEREKRGLVLFTDEGKGNCAQCHPSQIRRGAFPQFTDFGFIALGVPRNRSIPANANPKYFDLGLCGPLRTDLTMHVEYCGLFRTPTLRNVALRNVFFHNGIFHSLRDVLRFYAQRDLQPKAWYAQDVQGRTQPYDDLPEQYRTNINRDPPFDRTANDAPALTDDEIEDLIAFLRTLTDADLVNESPKN